MAPAPQIENLVFDGCSGTIHVEPLKDNRYRILGPEIAILTDEYGCGDVIEAVRNENNDLVVKRWLERGNYQTYEYCLAAGWHERDAIRKTLDKAQQLGGQWEGIFGGVLVIALPPECDYDPSQDITDAMTKSTGDEQ